MNFTTSKVMTKKKSLVYAAAVAALLCNLALIAADAPSLYTAQPKGSKIIIEGDSTVHKWTMEGPLIGGKVEFPAGVKIDMAQATVPGLAEGKVAAKVQAKIPVRSIKSGHDIMDGLYQEALKATNFPAIVYNLTEMTLKPGHVAGKPFEFDTKGDLSFAGVTNSVNMTVKMESTDKAVKITGNCPLKMTAFGIKPPAPNIGLGLMRCADDVNIVFEWSVAQAVVPATAAAK